MDTSGCPAVPWGPCYSLGAVVCKAGKCGVEYEAGVAPSQVYGNCKENFCGVDGGEYQSPDAGNWFDDGNPCTSDTCSIAGKPLNMGTPGAICMTQGMQGVCAASPDQSNLGLQTCQCDQTSPSACIPGATVCVQGVCAPMHCANGMQDSDETDLDCGGSACPPCQVGQECMSPRDCYSQVCAAPDGGTPRCQQPSCSDSAKNGQEADRDCGGPTCKPCGIGLDCLLPRDCESGVCMPTGIPGQGQPDQCQPPSCSDGLQNGSETGIDCGGDGGCRPCADGG